MLLETVMYADVLSASWARAVAVAAVSFVSALLVRRLMVSRLDAVSRRTVNPWDDVLTEVLRSTRISVLLIASVYAGVRVLQPPPTISLWLRGTLVVALLVQVGQWCTAAARGVIGEFRLRHPSGDGGASTMFAALTVAAQVLIWTTVLLLVLGNLGVNITAFVASLGVGGVAIALATQKILGDLFASLAIVLDKPFVIGDFLVVGDLMGTVERVGLKTTRVRSLSGEQLIFSNGDLLDSRLRNYGRMQERRVLFRLGVTYQTPRHLLERIPDMLREAVEAQAPVRFDRAHFAAYGSSSIDFEVVYYVLSPDFNRYMDIQQAVNLSVHGQFEAAGVEFAYPTQTLLLQRATTTAASAETYAGVS